MTRRWRPCVTPARATATATPATGCSGRPSKQRPARPTRRPCAPACLTRSASERRSTRGRKSLPASPRLVTTARKRFSPSTLRRNPRALDWLGASGGIVANAEDTAHFGHALFTGHVVGEKALRTLVDVDVTRGLPGTTECHAQAMLDRRGTPFGPSWSHGGNAGSFRSWLRHYQDADLTIAVNVNSGAFAGPIADALAAVAFGDTPAAAPGGRCDEAIAIRSADGTVRRLPDEPGFDGMPAWSPGGKSIAWLTNRADQIDVIVGSADGHALERLTNDAAHEARPSWSPDGSRIVFSSDRDGDHELYAMRVTDGATVKLTDNEVDDWLPAWSPDGTSIAYIRSDGSNELRMISADGSLDRAVPVPTVAPVAGLVARWGADRVRVGRHDLDGQTRPAASPNAWRSSSCASCGSPHGRPAPISCSSLTATCTRRDLTARTCAGSRQTSTEELTPAWAPDGATSAYELDSWGRRCAVAGASIDTPPGVHYRPATQMTTYSGTAARHDLIPVVTGGRTCRAMAEAQDLCFFVSPSQRSQPGRPPNVRRHAPGRHRSRDPRREEPHPRGGPHAVRARGRERHGPGGRRRARAAARAR